MLATTIQITNNPPHTTHTNKRSLAGCAGNHHQQVADAHTVLNVNPTVCLSATKLLCPTQKRTHTHHPPIGDEHMQAQENKPTHQPHKGRHARSLPKMGSLERR